MKERNITFAIFLMILVTAIGTVCQKQVTQADDRPQEPLQNEYATANAGIVQEQTMPQNESKKAAASKKSVTIVLVGYVEVQIFFIK